MQNILKALELKNELDTLRPLSKDQESKIMQKFRLDWNYHSNHLEGNSLTFGETKNLILHGITAQGKPLKDHFEITGHNEALNLVIDIVKEERPITENFIRELHELLLKEPYYVDAITADGAPTKKLIQVGKYKTSPNHVKTSTGEIFRFAEPEETHAKMHDLLQWYNIWKNYEGTNPIILAAEFHYKFIIIHPFDDGNGRLARILMNFILMSFNYPPVIIKTDDKQNYFFALRQADIHDLDFFIDYIAKNLVRSLEIMIAGAKGESIEEPNDIDKQISLLEHKLKGIGKKLTVYQSTEVMSDLFHNSLFSLIRLFYESNEKLNKFYFNNSSQIIIDGNYHASIGMSDTIDTIINFIFEKTSFINKIEISYLYNTFSYSDFSEFNYSTSLEFSFSKTKYEIKIGKISYSKYYDEELTNEEMRNSVNIDIKLHTAVIEQKIAELENKQNQRND